MNYKINQIEDPFPYAKVAELFEKTYFKEYIDAGALKWDERYAKFYFDSIEFEEESKKFIFAAYAEEKIIGTIVGHRDEVILDGELKLKILNFGLLAVDPDYRRQGIAKSLLSKLIEIAKKEKIDIIMAFPERGRFGDSLLKEHFEFRSYGNNKHLIKLMEDTGLEVLRKYMNKNPILVKIAALYSHIPDLDKPKGSIREGKHEDLQDVLDIINSYKNRVPLAEIYSLKGFQQSLENFFNMKTHFGEPWSFYWFVLEKHNKIIATINYRIEMATFEFEEGGFVDLPVSLLSSVGFHKNLDLEEKIKFISSILRKIRTDHPEVFIAQITTCQHEMKVFRKLKFPSDQSIYYLFMKPLTKKGMEINRYKKYKDFFLNYYR